MVQIGSHIGSQIDPGEPRKYPKIGSGGVPEGRKLPKMPKMPKIAVFEGFGVQTRKYPNFTEF